MKGEMSIFIESLQKEIKDLKKELEQNDLGQRAKKSLFGQVSVERLTEENKALREKNEELQKLVDEFDAGVYR